MRRVLVVAALAALGGCTTTLPAPEVLSPERFASWDAPSPPQEYRFLPGDEFDVRLIHNPEFSDRLVVAPDGSISMPLAGFVQAAGQTPRQLQAELKARLGKELLQPEVTIIPRTFASQRFFIGGEVATPGVYNLIHGTGVLQAVLTAGGFKTTANEESVILIRRPPQETAAMRLVNLKAVVRQGVLQEDTPLQALDVVFVPRTGIAEAGLFVEQYIRNLLPFDRSLTYSLNPTK